MAGLVMSNVGQAISGFGANVGNLMFKSIGDEADRDARIAARKEEWMARLEDRRDARTENNDLKRELLEMKLDAGAAKASGSSSSGGKSGGINMEDIKPGGSQEVWMAAQMEMTVPQYTEFYNSMKSGDKTAFLQKVTTQAATGMGAYQGQTAEQVSAETKMDVPPGFEAEYKAKMKKLGQLQESYALGGHYDDVMKGRQQGFQTGVGEKVLAGELKPGVASEAVAASLAKERMKVEGGEKLNVFTGESSTTPVGKSQINENNAQATKAKEAGGTGGAKPVRVQSTKEDSDGNMILVMTDGSTKPMLGTDGKPVRSAAFNKEVSKIITKLEEDDSSFKKLSPDEKRKRAEQRLTGKSSEAAPAASSTSVATPVTQADFDKLPSGAKYRNPKDGKTYTKK